MTTVLGAGLLLVVVAGYALFWCRSMAAPTDNEELFQHEVLRHAARRRLQVARLRTQIRRDAARLRRELDQELDGIDRRLP